MNHLNHPDTWANGQVPITEPVAEFVMRVCGVSSLEELEAKLIADAMCQSAGDGKGDPRATFFLLAHLFPDRWDMPAFVDDEDE